MAHRAKRGLYLIHRWIGIVTCLLFLIWFVSGLVMVYVRYPDLSEPERMAGLPAIDWSKVRIGPADAKRTASPRAPARTIALEMIAGDPVWRFTPLDSAANDARLAKFDATVTVSAATGVRLARFDAAQATRIAGAFARARVAEVEQLARDQWTVEERYDAHRPLHRVRLAGPDGRDLYVSSTTGAVLQEANANERFWNWVGSVPHWIYWTALRQHGEAYRQVVIWVTGPCILVAITGIWIGMLRTRIGNHRFKGGRMTPYHGWMLWHHVAGLAGGLTLTLWIFSGWLSVDPGRMFNSSGIDPEARAAYLGARPLPPLDPARLAEAAGADAKRVEYFWAAGRPWVVVERRKGYEALDARSLRPAQIDEAALIASAAKLIPGAAVASVERVTAPEFYWYELGMLPRLPVLRIKFADAAGTWVHLDPKTGRLLGTIDQRRRVYRWAYDLFHKWDLNLLTLNRPAWELLLSLFTLIGIASSVSGIWIGWLRLRGRSAIRLPLRKFESR